MGMSEGLLARLYKHIPRLRNYERWIRRFARRALDDSVFLTSPAHFADFFNDFVKGDVSKGDREKVIMDSKKFSKELLKKLKPLMNAQKAVYFTIKHRADNLSEHAEKIKKEIQKKYKNSPEGEIFFKFIHDEFEQTLQPMRNALNKIITLVKDLAFNRHQLITVKIAFDSSLKHEMAFAGPQLRKLHKDEENILEGIEHQIQHSPNLSQDALKNDFKGLINDYKKEAATILTEAQDLVILLQRIDEAKEKVRVNFLNELRKTGLDDIALNEISKAFTEISKEITDDAKFDWELYKSAIPEFQAVTS